MSIRNKVIYIGAFRFPNGDAAASRVLNNGKIFRDLGYSVDYISWGGVPRVSDKEDDGFYYYQGFKYYNTHDIDKKGLNPLRRIYNFFFAGKNSISLLSELIDKTDIVIAYNPSSYFTKKLKDLCKKYSILYISDITEWNSSEEFPGGQFAPPYWVNEYNMRITQKYVGNKIVISSFLENYYSSSNNIVLPPLIDSNDDKWHNQTSKLPKFNGLRIVYAGTPGRKDLLETMLKAVLLSLQKKIELQFIIVGVKEEDITAYEYYRDIQKWPDNILFVGQVPQSDVPLYYKSSDFSVIVRENVRKSMAGFPTKFVESMMSGCPVIVNITSDLSNYIQDGINGIVLPDFSVKSLQTALEKASSLNFEDINRMKSQAFFAGKEYFHFGRHVESVNKFLGECK